MNIKYPHFAIPEIYGESLSYYEVLRKLVNAMNVMIKNYNTVPDQIAEAVANLDASQLFSAVLNQLIHSIATDNTKSTNAVKVYKKHDLLYATFNDTVNLYESLIDFTTGTETELIIGTNIREVNISELFIELRELIKNEARTREHADQLLQTNIDNEARAREQAVNENSEEISTMRNDITGIENKNNKQDTELSTLRTMLSSPYNFKGKVSSISALPASGNINDTYYVQDVKYKVTWTGSAWVQSSISEADYQTELGELKGELVNCSELINYSTVKEKTGFQPSAKWEGTRDDTSVTDYIAVNSGDTIILNWDLGSNLWGHLFYSKKGVCVGGIVSNADSREFTIPDGVFYIRLMGATVSFNNNKLSASIKKSIASSYKYIDDLRNEISNRNLDFTKYRYSYIKDGALTSNNDTATYTQINLGSLMKKMLAKISMKKPSTSPSNATPVATLISIPTLHDNISGPVQDIGLSSIHITFNYDSVNVGYFEEHSLKIAKDINYSTPIVRDGVSEYTIGMEFVSENTIRVYLPDGTYQDVTNENFSAHRGQYIVYETSTLNGDTYQTPTDESTHVIFRGFYCSCENGMPLVDDFQREDGYIGVATSGHTYRLFTSANVSGEDFHY